MCGRRLKAIVDLSMVMKALFGGILQTNYALLNLYFHYSLLILNVVDIV
jgi:hypothetical protein